MKYGRYLMGMFSCLMPCRLLTWLNLHGCMLKFWEWLYVNWEWLYVNWARLND